MKRRTSPTDVLEQVRLLTNLETNTQKLLQIILIGQPELRELLDRNELRQLAQRITGRYHLDPLSPDETAAYVRHRLRVRWRDHRYFHRARALRGVSPFRRRAARDQRDRGSRPARRLHAGQTSRRWQPRTRRRGGSVRQAVRRALAAVGWRRRCRRCARRHRHPAVAVRAMGELVIGSEGQHAARQRAETPRMPSWASTAPGHRRHDAAKCHRWRHAADRSRSVSFSRNIVRRRCRTKRSASCSRIWNLRYTAGNEDPCTQALSQGLECLVQRGSSGQLRQFNRPALLMLNDEAGNAHQVLLTNLGDERAKVELGGSRHEVGIGELSRYWFGDFVDALAPRHGEREAALRRHAWRGSTLAPPVPATTQWRAARCAGKRRVRRGPRAGR